MKKVLVVDDDPDILEAVQLVLMSDGYNSEAITKGDETYKKIKEYKPDLIILDVLLSGNDGRTICKNLKKAPATKKIPIIFMSALSGQVTKRTVAMQAEDFFTKPLDLPRLQLRIGELLRSEAASK